jgi:hypothetical protein
MNSDLRIQASRRNGAKSRGPKTPEGKLISSRNAVRHDMLAKTILIEGESAGRFAQLLAELKAELQPRRGIETTLVETMAVCRWRQLRLWGLESAGVSHEIRKRKDAAEHSAASPTHAVLALRNLTDNSRILEFVSRHETRCDRLFAQSLARLQRIQSRRAEGKDIYYANEPELQFQASQTKRDTRPTPPKNEPETNPGGPETNPDPH